MHNEELLNLCLSPNIIKVDRSRTIGYSRHVACMFWSKRVKEIYQLEDLGVGGKLIDPLK